MSTHSDIYEWAKKALQFPYLKTIELVINRRKSDRFLIKKIQLKIYKSERLIAKASS